MSSPKPRISLNERIRLDAQEKARAKISSLAFTAVTAVFLSGGAAYAFSGNLHPAQAANAPVHLATLPKDSLTIGSEDITATPEPGTISLVALGLAGMVVMARRRKSVT